MPLQLSWRPNTSIVDKVPDSKVRGANMGPIWDRQDPGGLHVGPMNFAIWGAIYWGEHQFEILAITKLQKMYGWYT